MPPPRVSHSHAVLAIARKELLHVRRDKLSVIAGVVLSIVQVFIFGSMDASVHDLPTVVVDQDHSVFAREVIEKMHASGIFDIQNTTASLSEARTAVRAGRATIAIVIPPDFGREYAGGHTASLLAIVDATDPAAASQATSTIDAVARSVSVAVQHEANTPVQAHWSLAFNPNGRNSHFILPSLIMVMLGLGMVQAGSQSIFEERDRGTVDRLLMSPITHAHIMFGKLVVHLALALSQASILLLISNLAFDLPVQGSIALLAISSAVYFGAMLGIGALIGATASSHLEVGALTGVLFLPMLLLSGNLFPLTTLSRPLRMIAYALPVTHMINIVRGLTLRGSTASDLGAPLLVLLIVCPLMLGVALWRLRKAH